VAIDPSLKLNGNCCGDRGPGVAPKAEQHSHEIGEHLGGLAAALRWRYRGGVLDRGALCGGSGGRSERACCTVADLGDGKPTTGDLRFSPVPDGRVIGFPMGG
jgi:hypothetical protein